MLKLKLQYFGHPTWRTHSLEKTLMLGRLKADWEGNDRGWDGWLASPIWWTWVWANSGNWWWTGKPGVVHSMGSQSRNTNWATELSDIWASLVAQLVKNLPAVQETWFNPWLGKMPWRRAWQPTPIFLPGESPWTEEPGEL